LPVTIEPPSCPIPRTNFVIV